MTDKEIVAWVKENMVTVRDVSAKIPGLRITTLGNTVTLLYEEDGPATLENIIRKRIKDEKK